MMDTQAKIQENIDLEALPLQNGQKVELNPKDFLINLADDVPDPHPLLSIDGKTIFSPQNIGIIKAKAKSGKSFLCSIIVSALLTGRWDNLTASLLIGKSKVILIDSEQADAHVHKLARRVHSMAGVNTSANYPYFEVYATKDLTNDERFELLETLAKDPECGLIVLDGVVDLVNDFNSLEECSEKKD